MKFSSRLAACVCALLSLLALSSAAHAGMDAYRVVVALSGKAWVRSFDRTKHGLKFGTWKPLHVGDQISPDSEMRVEMRGSLRLQMGDIVDDPAQMPTDAKLYYDNLSGGSAVRLNDQHWAVAHHTPILQKLRGKVTLETVAGRIPAKDYWKKQGVNRP